MYVLYKNNAIRKIECLFKPFTLYHSDDVQNVGNILDDPSLYQLNVRTILVFIDKKLVSLDEEQPPAPQFVPIIPSVLFSDHELSRQQTSPKRRISEVPWGGGVVCLLIFVDIDIFLGATGEREAPISRKGNSIHVNPPCCRAKLCFSAGLVACKVIGRRSSAAWQKLLALNGQLEVDAQISKLISQKEGRICLSSTVQRIGRGKCDILSR